jgi:regulatory protein
MSERLPPVPSMAVDPGGPLMRLALRLLAAREHAAAELRHKLAARGWSAAEVEALLAVLSERGLLSDARFVESYVRERMAKGFGPRRIRAELRERGVADDQTDRWLPADDDAWVPILTAAHDRKFGKSPPADPGELARRARFLEYRGFSSAQIGRFLDLAG